MKKNKLFITALTALCSLSVAGCGSNNNSDSSKNQITNSNSNDITISTLSKLLENARQSIRISGKVDQVANLLDAQHGNPTGKKMENSFDVEFVYQSDEETAYSAIVVDNQGFTTYDTVAFEGEDGYAYTYELGYDNVAKRVPLEDTNGYKVNFGYYCTNPFSMLIESDFTKIDNNSYKLSRTKAAMFASNVLSVVDQSAFLEVIDSFVLTVENGNFTTIKVIPTSVEDYFTDYSTMSNQYYMLDSVATLTISDIGTAKVKAAKSREHKPEHEKLQAALDKIQDNYTITATYTPYEDGIKGTSSKYVHYFTEDSYFFKCGRDDEAPEAQNDVILHQFPNEETLTPLGYDASSDSWTEEAASRNGFGALTGLTRKDVTPVISDVKAEIFDYEEKLDCYRICEEMRTYIGAIALIPPLGALVQYWDGYGDDCYIELNSKGELDQIVVSYKMDFSVYVVSGTMALQFDNVGTTVLPFDAESKIR